MTSLCNTCLSLSGEKPLFPESRMFDGIYWSVEHAHPVAVKGWIVIILKRHAEALHEVTTEEFQELARLQEKLSKALHTTLGSAKEYSACFAEGEHFNHIHFHLIAKPANLAITEKGPHIFSNLGVSEEVAINKDELIEFCNRIKRILSRDDTEPLS